MPTPALPLELWTKILSSLTEPHYLPRTWLSCRRVSHAFKVATEAAFTDVYLRRMVIRTELAEPIDLTFSGFSEDRSFVCFRHDSAAATANNPPLRMPPELRARLEERAEQAWEREHQLYLDSMQTSAPRMLYQVWLMGHVEDTRFPGLQVDIPSRSLRFEWKPLLNNMFGEIEYRKWILRGEWESLLAESDELELKWFPPDTGIPHMAAVIESQVRTVRTWQHAWNPGSNRRRDWQIKALRAYRDLGDKWWQQEEDWGRFYDEVPPRFTRKECLEPPPRQR
ncbi:hypothetical protein BJ166DRAFT_339766 [Pestalotiopsis sp. NC0098]|nr:hypothetical protein BJ166DRAFT_339766 [Pestalotiopsis sp. NC0098]